MADLNMALLHIHALRRRLNWRISKLSESGLEIDTGRRGYFLAGEPSHIHPLAQLLDDLHNIPQRRNPPLWRDELVYSVDDSDVVADVLDGHPRSRTVIGPW